MLPSLRRLTALQADVCRSTCSRVRDFLRHDRYKPQNETISSSRNALKLRNVNVLRFLSAGNPGVN